MAPAPDRARSIRPSLQRIVEDDGLRAELLAMLASAHDRERLHAHGDRLWAILDDYETWPGRHLVGEDGSRAAWIIAQFSIEDPALQKRCLEALEVAVACGDADPVHLAYLVDRVRMADGLDQLYGSQFVIGDDGELVPWPVDDEARVDARRRRLGLVPFAAHAAAMVEAWRARGDQPDEN